MEGIIQCCMMVVERQKNVLFCLASTLKLNLVKISSKYYYVDLTYLIYPSLLK
jgi:hypothetical protein